jgi:hypothetical protein
MKKVSFVVAILVSAALAGCHKKAANTTPTGGGAGSAMGSDMGSAAAPAGSDTGSAAGGGSAM